MPGFGIFRKNKSLVGIRRYGRIFDAMFLLAVICLPLFSELTRAADVPVKFVTISSERTNYANNEPGSWNITKSAEWIGTGKARITFEVESAAKYEDNKNLDVLMVIDNSGSMSGEKMNQVKADATDLMDILLSDSNNRAALVTFESSAQIVSDFTNSKADMISYINSITTAGSTNYNQGYIKALEVLDDYTRRENTDLIMLFLTDGAPNEEVSNEIAQYETLKSLYPYMTINGIQYEMGDTVFEPIANVSDYQYIATLSSLNNVLFEATIIPHTYDNFVITDYINNDYWHLYDANRDGVINITDTIQDISASVGEVGDEISVVFDEHSDQVRWDLSGLYRSGGAQTLTIDIELNSDTLELIIDGQGNDLLLPTNTHETIKTSIKDVPDEDIDSDLTPILKSAYDVIYDANEPSDCEPTGTVPATASHTIFTAVGILDNSLSCSGYAFKGWQVATSGVSRINDDYFRMPGEDVYIKAIWSKPGISKSMDGDVYIKAIAVFDTGQSVNIKLKRLSGQSDAYFNTQNTTITAIKKAEALSASVNVNDDSYIISTPDSMTPIYAWYDEGIIYYYSDAEETYLNQNASNMFREFRGLATIDGIEEWITDNVTDMGYMFVGTGFNINEFILDLSSWNTSNVTNMIAMFDNAGYSASTWSVGDLSKWGTSKVTDMSSMFRNASVSTSTFDISYVADWDTSSVTNMSYMFYYAGCKATNWSVGDLSKWDTSSVTNMTYMFGGAGAKATTWSVGDLSKWDTSKVTNMNGLFSNAGEKSSTWLIGDVSDWDTSSVTNMSRLFWAAGNSAESWEIDLSKWDVSNVTNMEGMFGGVNNTAAGHIATTWSVGDLSKWDTSKVTNMSRMFGNAGAKATAWSLGDLSKWDTSNVTDMSCMFGDNFGGAGERATTWYIGDISQWNTSKVTNMYFMFRGAGSNATVWSIGDLSNWDTSNVTNMNSMFGGAGQNATDWSVGDLSRWKVSKVIDMSSMFGSAGYSATTWSVGDLSKWDTSSVTTMQSMFGRAGYSATEWSIGNISNWDVSNVVKMNGMFSDAGYMVDNFELDLSGWNTLKVKDMSYMFNRAGYNATTLSIKGLSGWNTSGVTNMSYMFDSTGFHATTWSIGDLSSWNTSSATGMSSLFSGAGANVAVWSVGDLSKWDTSKVTNMSYMFNNAGIMATTWSVGDISKWDTSSVTNMQYMFSSTGRNVITWSVGDISNWDTSKVTNMSRMFSYAGLSAVNFELDLSGWNTSSVTDMDYMFNNTAGYGTANFKLDLSGWDTSSVTKMDSNMFNYAGHNATTWSVKIPATNGAGIENTESAMYGNSTSVYASPESGRSFTLAN